MSLCFNLNGTQMLLSDKVLKSENSRNFWKKVLKGQSNPGHYRRFERILKNERRLHVLPGGKPQRKYRWKNLMPQSKKIGWEDVLPAAEVAFNIWVGQPEIEWAKTAWRHIMKAGLANYANELEYCQVCLRFLALADIYYDWCSMAWGEDHPDDNILYASECFEMRSFRLGQLIGSDELVEEDITPEEFVKFATRSLVGTTRREVVQTILHGYGGTMGLLVSLYNSTKSKNDDNIDGESMSDTFYHWIKEGCPPWREESMG